LRNVTSIEAVHSVPSLLDSWGHLRRLTILEPLTDTDRAYMLTALPPPVRLLYRVSGKKAWTKYATRLREGK